MKESRFHRIMKWLAHEAPFMFQQAVGVLIPILIKIGIKGLEDL